MEKKEPQWNEKEKRMLKAMPENEPIAIKELAEACFKSMGTSANKRGNSWVRNCLRKPVRLKAVKQVGRGLYLKLPTATAKKATRSTASRKAKKAAPRNSASPTKTPAGDVSAPALQ